MATRREQVLARKKRLGRAASYRRLSELTGTSVPSIHQTLNDKPSAIPIDRKRILGEVEDALDQIESEQSQKCAA